jgi:signal transduction histidine kinase
MAKEVTVSLPGLVIALAVILLIILFWLFSRNAIRITSMLDSKESLEHSVNAFATVLGQVCATCPVPDTTKGETLTPQSCPQLFTLLDALEGTLLVNNDRAYVFVLDTHGNMVVNGGSPEIAKRGAAVRPGTNVYSYSDPDGNAAVQALLSKAAAGGGYVEYKWPCPKTRQTVKKVAYVRAIPHSNWVIGSGLYI